MGEGPEANQRLTVRQAAARLGISEGAVRSRIKRGTLRTERLGARVVVVLGADEPSGGPSDDPSDQPQASLVRHLESEVAHLRLQLEQANERDHENRRIIAALTQRIPEIEAPASGATESPTAATERPGRVAPQPEVEGPQEATGPVPWWRRIFKGA